MTSLMESVLYFVQVMQQGTTLSLLDQLAQYDTATWRHSLGVAEYALAIGIHMKLSPEKLHHLACGALLHDIGKLRISKEILCKPGRLTNEEYQIIKQHPEFGAEILAEYGYKEKDILDIARYHHVNFDGTGYPTPMGPISELVPIIRTADTYDAMTRERPYQSAIPSGVVLELMSKDVNTVYQPETIQSLMYV